MLLIESRALFSSIVAHTHPLQVSAATHREGSFAAVYTPSCVACLSNERQGTKSQTREIE